MVTARLCNGEDPPDDGAGTLGVLIIAIYGDRNWSLMILKAAVFMREIASLL